MSEAAVEEFLAHYGVPGMKWGVRKERTPEEKAARSARNKKIAKTTGKVAIGVAVAAGALYVNKQMKQANANKSYRELMNSAPQSKKVGEVYADVFTRGGGSRQVKVSTIEDARRSVDTIRRSKSGAIPMPAAASQKSGGNAKAAAALKRMAGEAAARRADEARRAREVNSELKSWYNESSTPVKDRWYMEER